MATIASHAMHRLCLNLRSTVSPADVGILNQSEDGRTKICKKQQAVFCDTAPRDASIPTVKR
jgi:hypothetical protein